MNRMLRGGNVSLVLVAACAVFLLTTGAALADATWVDKVSNAMAFYKKQYTTVTHPASNWQPSAWTPYEKQLTMGQDAVKAGDKQKAKAETDKFLTMLNNREHGIHTTAAGGLRAETLIYAYGAFK